MKDRSCIEVLDIWSGGTPWAVQVEFGETCRLDNVQACIPGRVAGKVEAIGGQPAAAGAAVGRLLRVDGSVDGGKKSGDVE